MSAPLLAQAEPIVEDLEGSPAVLNDSEQQDADKGITEEEAAAAVENAEAEVDEAQANFDAADQVADEAIADEEAAAAELEEANAR